MVFKDKIITDKIFNKGTRVILDQQAHNTASKRICRQAANRLSNCYGDRPLVCPFYGRSMKKSCCILFSIVFLISCSQKEKTNYKNIKEVTKVSNTIEEKNLKNISLNKFVENYKPIKCVIPDNELVEKYKELVPDELIELWKTAGFGFYKFKDCELQIINPDLYIQNLCEWFNRPVTYDRIPIAISPFGIIIYYRKLSETDYDFAYLDPHTSQSEVLSWNISSFFNDLLLDKDIKNFLFEPELTVKAVKKKGSLDINEMFIFVPALRLGGNRTLEYVDKCNAQVQLDILLQLAKENN